MPIEISFYYAAPLITLLLLENMKTQLNINYPI